MRTVYCLLLLLSMLCRSAAAQGYLALYQYFEADSTARPGYSSIVEKTTQARISRSRELTEIKTVESFYDEAGRLIREERSNQSGLESELNFEYDSAGRLSHIEQTGWKLKYEAFAQYDGEGRLSEVIQCSEDKPCSARHYVFDEDNTERLYIPKQTIELRFDKNKPGSLFGLSAHNREKDELARERFFDPEGKLEEIKEYRNGALSVAWLFEYDHTGRKAQIWVYNSSNKKILAAEYVYDGTSGLLLSEKIYVWVVGDKIMPYKDKGPETTFLKYDAEKRLIGTESDNPHAGKTREYTYHEY